MSDSKYYFAHRDHGGLIIFGLYWDWYAERCIKPHMLGHVEQIERWLNLTEKYPHYRYTLHLDGFTYEDMAVKAPGLIAKLRKAIREGRAEVVEGSYCQPYHHLFGGESTIRQLELGRKTIKEVLGCDVVTMSNQEHAWHTQMPQILAGLGYKYVILQSPWTKRGWCPTHDAEKIWWVGLDGSRIETVPTWSGIPTGWMRLFDPQSDDQLAQARSAAREKGINNVLLSYSNDICWAARRISEEFIARSAIGDVPVTFTTDGEFARSTPPPTEKVRFEMDQFRSRITYGQFGEAMYKKIKLAENQLLTAEKLLACCELVWPQADLEERRRRLEQAWKSLSVAQNHDTYCVAGHWDSVHETTICDYLMRFVDESLAEASRQIDDLLARLSSSVDTRPADGPEAGMIPVIVFNPLSWRRVDITELTMEFPPGEARSLALLDGSREVPFHTAGQARHDDGSLKSARLVWEAEVPSLGYRVYHLKPTPAEPPAAVRAETVGVGRHTMENRFYRLTFDPARGGGLVEIFDKRLGRNLIDATHHLGNAFVGLDESSEDAPASVDFVGSGPVTAAEVSGNFRGIPFDCRVTLYENIDRIDFVTAFHFGQELVVMHEHEALKVVFNPAAADRFHLDMPFGVYESTQELAHGIDFLDASTADGGFALINGGTPGYQRGGGEEYWFEKHEIPDDVARGIGLANILACAPRDRLIVETEWEGKVNPRGPKRELAPTLFAYAQGCVDEEGRVRGFWFPEQRYRYSILGHVGRWDDGRVVHGAAEFNNPLVARRVPVSDGKLPRVFSFLEIEPDNVLLSAMHPVDDGINLRFVEAYGREGDLTARLGVPVTEAEVVDLSGRPVERPDLEGGAVRCRGGAWKIVNVRVNEWSCFATDLHGLDL